MNQASAFRGQPLMLLGGLLALWVSLRALTWDPPFETPLVPVARELAPARAAVRAARPAGVSGPATGALSVPVDALSRSAITPAARGPDYSVGALPPVWTTAPVEPVMESRPGPFTTAQSAVGHSLMLLAGLAQMEVPGAILAYLQPKAPPARPVAPQAAPLLLAGGGSAPARSRWSADAWLLWRDDTSTPVLTGQPSYGRSQAGAVLRYRLAEGGLGPQAFMRASAALSGPRDGEVAIGLSARPLPALPVRVAGEARAYQTARGTEVRAAAYAVTELAPVSLPLGLRGEAYAQAGYVGGRFATPFVDGQARIEREIAGPSGSEIIAGAGAWGGAQKGAARLDVGPTAAVSFRLGEARGRVAADYRFRVMGDAAPASGPALTLSAGF